MDPQRPAGMSRRERQIMDIVYRRGRATAAEVLDDLPDPPTYSAVRAALRLLEEKGTLAHEMDGKRYVYVPTTPRKQARTTALHHLVRTFFNGSP
ncbi:MAG TPA: BlaI/MecI/CopY family transcriptional regulator, partial [Longimicrobium sp.]|nr:BlaI/MecI/CopY family transcriptional regulator [Longimicrobium sp.]